jgi:hypothetical protein
MSLKHRPATAVVPAQSADGPVLARRQEGTTGGRRAAAPAKQARSRYWPPSTCEVPPICLALTSRRPAPSPGTGQHRNHARASDSVCYGGDGEAPGRSPAESYCRAHSFLRSGRYLVPANLPIRPFFCWSPQSRDQPVVGWPGRGGPGLCRDVRLYPVLFCVPARLGCGDGRKRRRWSVL